MKDKNVLIIGGGVAGLSAALDFANFGMKVGIVDGFSSHHHPFFALNEDNCLDVKDVSCTARRDACPENACTMDSTRRR